MKTDINFSYPVLGVRDDILPAPNINKPLIVEDEESDSFNIEFHFDYENEDIRLLINQGKAVYCCEVECSHTLYRKRFHSQNESFSCMIPCTMVGKDISLTFSVVAITDIKDYSNSNSHPDYKGYKFDLTAGDILGLFGRFKFYANLKANQFNATSDFLSIVNNEDEDSIPTFDLNGDKVVLKLPPQQYYLFFNLRDNDSCEEILMSTFALQAITEAIHAISIPDNLYKNANFKWVDALISRIETIPECEGLDLRSDAYKIAQLIMRDERGDLPFYRMLKRLTKR